MRWTIGGAVIVAALAGCGRNFWFEARAPWRRDAEIACLNSGTLKEGSGIVRIAPIDGPGMCGADFPLKVAALGESGMLAFASEPMRPPGSVPGVTGSASQQLGAPPAPLRAPPDWQRIDRSPLPSQERARSLPPLGPPPQQHAAAMPVEVRPTATLACPVVSALDRWIVTAVQPAALKWFRQPVAEIKQISAYSCRGMNGQAGAPISEHAFGNALDIAAFVLADGRRVTIRDGWRGAPEEQGFLRDIQSAACDHFNTVLAPGSNAFHYDHIHVDLMRRASGRRICQPNAVDGEWVAAQARQNPAYASRTALPQPRFGRSTNPADDPFAWRGDVRRSSVASGGAIAGRRNAKSDDNDWVEEPGPRPAIDWSSSRGRLY